MNEISRRRFLQGMSVTAAAGSSLVPRLVFGADNKILRTSYEAQFKSLDPGFMFGSSEMMIQLSCLPVLAKPTPGGEKTWGPSYFVTKLEYLDDTSIAFALRPDLKWSNGFGQVTTEDVQYSFDRGKNGEWDVKWQPFEGVEIIDSLNGVIKLKYPFAPVWTTVLTNGIGCIVCKKAVEAMGGRFDTEIPAVCGPYYFTNFRSEVGWEVHRNPEWNGPKPDWNEARWTVISEEKTAELAVEAGELDIAYVSVESAPRLRSSPPEGTTYLQAQGKNWCWIGMNMDHPLLKDVRVRRAIQYAVDVDMVLEAAWSGVPKRARGIVPFGQLGYRTESKFDKPNIDKAKALLAEAGVSNLTITLKCQNMSEFVTASQVVQANLAEIGINLEVEPMEAGLYWIQGIEAEGEQWKDLQLFMMEYGDSPDPSQACQWYVSSQVGVWNWERFSNAEFDQLHEDAMKESDEKKRHAMYIQMQEIMEDTGAYIPLHHKPMSWLHRNHVEPVLIEGSIIDVPKTRLVG